LQLRRLHEQSQPLEQLDEVIEKIRRLMVESAETASKERLREEEKKQQQRNNNNNKEVERGDSSRRRFGIQEDFHS
jgi:ribosomal protein L12E/L44/L45/RPP1/RPP2